MENSFKHGIRDGIPICLGYLSVAFAFGIFSVSSGLSVIQSVLISMTNVTSAGQLAGVPIIISSLPVAEMILTQCIINLRYALMSISLSQKLDSSVTILDRLIIAFVNTDEVFAVASSNKKNLGKSYLYGLILTPFCGWTVGTLVGAIAGNILPISLVGALGIAIYGMFIAIVIPASKKNSAVFGALLTSVILSCIMAYTPILKMVSSSFAIILCAVTASIIFAAVKPLSEECDQ